MNDNNNNYNLIVALCKNGGIGLNGKLPWSIKEDMKYFTKQTKGNGNNAVIMGRNTWESLPNKYLIGRDNFIISSKMIIDKIMDDGHRMKTFKNLDEVNAFCKSSANYDTIWIIGGAMLYKECLERNFINKCYITSIDYEYECDTFFYYSDINKWDLININSVITNVNNDNINNKNITIDFMEFKYKD
jgi:dihydrofolate reductase